MDSVYDPDAVARCYDLVAEAYVEQFLHELDHKPFDRMLLSWFAEQVPHPDPIVEMGCGPGHIAAFLHARGANISGIDLSPGIVEVARRQFPDIDFHQGDMLGLDLEPDALAGIAAFYAIVHFTLSEVEAALSEFRRVLRKDGILLFSFHIREEHDVIPVKGFLGKEGADVDFVAFAVDEIKEAVTRVGFQIQDVLIRHPYEGVEYPSRRCYIIARK